ncbi:MAG: PH domain-containing protein [Gammaproteobacteria bacterium]|nr:PH domain-containing protein [Gammaproteobacteria bacterium]
MKQNVAPTSLSIKIITLLILLMTAGMFIGAYYEPRLVWAGTVLAILVVLCYLSAPVAYEIKGDQLAIIRRIGNKIFGPVTRCSYVYDDKPSFGIRLWGNGGVFAGTGIFWNKKYGIFRAYVTTGSKSHLVLVETPATRVVITPENPDQFMAHQSQSRR